MIQFYYYIHLLIQHRVFVNIFIYCSIYIFYSINIIECTTEAKGVLPDTDINCLKDQFIQTKTLLSNDLNTIGRPPRAQSWFSSVKTTTLTEMEAKIIEEHVKTHIETTDVLVSEYEKINKEQLELKTSYDSLIESFNKEKKTNEELSTINKELCVTKSELQIRVARNEGYLQALGAELNVQGEVVRHNIRDEVKQAAAIVNRAGQEIQTLQEEISSLKENISNLSKMTLREEGNTAAIFRRLESMPTKKDLGTIVNEAIQRHVVGLRQDLPRELLDQQRQFITEFPAEEKKGKE